MKKLCRAIGSIHFVFVFLFFTFLVLIHFWKLRRSWATYTHAYMHTRIYCIWNQLSLLDFNRWKIFCLPTAHKFFHSFLSYTNFNLINQKWNKIMLWLRVCNWSDVHRAALMISGIRNENKNKNKEKQKCSFCHIFHLWCFMLSFLCHFWYIKNCWLTWTIWKPQHRKCRKRRFETCRKLRRTHITLKTYNVQSSLPLYNKKQHDFYANQCKIVKGNSWSSKNIYFEHGSLLELLCVNEHKTYLFPLDL